MTQVFESARVIRPASGPSARLAAMLARVAEIFRRNDRVIRPDSLSYHTLRDIGLAEDARVNHLLGDLWLRR